MENTLFNLVRLHFDALLVLVLVLALVLALALSRACVASERPNPPRNAR